jgi:carboxymethylenebutenolidase
LTPTAFDAPLGRRAFAVTTLASGFALAVQPVGAATITTDANGLTAGEVQIPVADGMMPAYRATPAKGSNHPIVLVIQEIFGVHEHIKDLCRRLAHAGYLAVAPELYARQGDVSKLTDIQQIMGVVNKVPDAQVMSDLDATAKWAAANGGNAAKMAVTGFCWGGRATWLYAAHNPQLKAAAPWYGPLVGDPSPLKPTNPVDIVKDLKVPVLGFYGARDTGITQEHVAKMREALTAAGNKNAEIIVWGEAGHGFNADYRPSYSASAAPDAWNRMMLFFKEHGVG